MQGLTCEKSMNASETLLFSGSSLASQVHAAAVNGHKSALLKQIAGKMFTLFMYPTSASLYFICICLTILCHPLK